MTRPRFDASWERNANGLELSPVAALEWLGCLSWTWRRR